MTRAAVGDDRWMARPNKAPAQATPADLTTGELLALSRGILAELRHRGVIRSGNAPAGDYAELLVQQATGGELAPNSQRSWDVETPAGEHLQVKARVVPNANTPGQRQLSVFRFLGL